MAAKTMRIRVAQPARPARHSAAERPPRKVKDMSPQATGTNVFVKAVQARVKHKAL